MFEKIKAWIKRKRENSERTAGGRQVDKAYRAGVRI